MDWADCGGPTGSERRDEKGGGRMDNNQRSAATQ